MVDVADSNSAILVKVSPLGPPSMASSSSGSAASNGETTPISVREEDRYGFFTDSDDQPSYEPLVDIKKVREREEKWLKMITNWKVWMEKKPDKLKERCRKGIPESLRGRVWMLLCGATELLEENKGVFAALITQPDNDVVTHDIERDLDRTFPSHVLFAKKGDQGQKDLRQVLKAYAMYNKKTGYCQAMAPVAATLLMHMPAEHAFWCLVQICEQYLPGYYSPGLHAFQIDTLILRKLLHKYIPTVAVFLDGRSPSQNPDDKKKGLDPVLYSTEWFMSIFSRSLPWATVLRVWDMFFFEGVKVLFKVALSVLNLLFMNPETRKECPGFFEVVRKMKTLPLSVTHENVLLPEILKYHIKDKELKQAHFDQADLHFTEERVKQMAQQAKRQSLASSKH